MYSKKWRRTKKAISIMVSVTMLSSVMGITVAAEPVSPDSQPMLEEESGLPLLNSQPMLEEESSKLPVLDVQPAIMTPTTTSGSGANTTEPGSQPDIGGDGANNVQLPNDSASSDKSGVPTYNEVYEAMIAFKDMDGYREGTTWTNFEPYGINGKESEYRWNGGTILGNVRSGVGCAAFAFILSDAAFGNLQAREDYSANKFENVKVGDILRINGNSHSVIVLQKTAAGVIIAEANYNKTVHWERVLSKDEVDHADFIVTRYPENYNPDNTENDVVEQSGPQGSLTWSLTKGGTLTISGSGDMEDFADASAAAWSGLNYHTIVIDKGVTSIGKNAFANSQATSLFLPSGLKSIGEQAFFSSNIVSATIPDTVSTIGRSAFHKCQKLISVSVSEGVKVIGDTAFSGCKELKYIDFPASITEIGEGAFQQCISMTRVRFMPGSSQVTLGDYLFQECSALKDVTLPETADSIGAGMFMSCNVLLKLYIPAGISEIRVFTKDGISAAVPFCTNLMEINFAGSESKWKEVTGGRQLGALGCPNATVNFNVKFPNPFEKDPNDPGDMMGGHTHNWSSENWNHDENYHWHECEVQGCPNTNNNEKDSYAEHSYGSWIVDVSATSYQTGSKHRDCTVCSYRQTESIPADSSSSSGGSSGGGNSGSSGGSSSGGSSNPVKPSDPNQPTEPDSSDNNSNSTDDSSNNTNDGSSSDTDKDSVNDTDNTENTGSSQKQLKSKFKKRLKTEIKQELKPQLKKELKKQLKAELKRKTKVKMKKQLRVQLKPQLKTKLKKQLKKKFGEKLGKDFSRLFDEQFNEQYSNLFNEQFNELYKKLVSKQKKGKL